jgi:hypothetical protein
MPKVFCNNCRNFINGDYGNYCDAVDEEGYDWYSETRKCFTPSEQNKNNDCKHWLHKRSLIEWLCDLTNRQ